MKLKQIAEPPRYRKINQRETYQNANIYALLGMDGFVGMGFWKVKSIFPWQMSELLISLWILTNASLRVVTILPVRSKDLNVRHILSKGAGGIVTLRTV
jgi:hypothetical protein